jgi:hypothetical protein
MIIPMNQITKDVFISTIESLQLQASKDIDASNAISQVFNTDCFYDNDVLVKALIGLLQVFFPKDENGFCEIEHYCYDMNFGKISDQELITPEDLWYRLDNIKQNDILEFKPTDKFLQDEAGQWPDHFKDSFRPLFCAKQFLEEKASEEGKSFPYIIQPIPSTHPLIDDNPESHGE